ncbi:MAG: hypothetical protein KDD22_03215, partial [Bdellovibrionales bacterium]|nr:hypothetical protein [Bdellovibrionales bacterium]
MLNKALQEPTEAIADSQSWQSRQMIQSVLHDLNSPLSLLSCVRNEVKNWNSETSELIILAIQQIEKISGEFRNSQPVLPKREPKEPEPTLKIAPPQNTQVILETKERNFSAVSEFIKNLRRFKKMKQLEYSNLTIDLKIEKDLTKNSQIRGSIEGWTRTLSNMVNNSMEAMSSQANAKIEITLRKIQNPESKSNYLEISLRDWGTGFEESLLAQFNSASEQQPLRVTSTKSKNRGYGIAQILRWITETNSTIEFANCADGGQHTKISIKSDGLTF